MEAFTAEEGNQEDHRVSKEAGDDQLLLADLRSQLVDSRVEEHADGGHGGRQYESPLVLDAHQLCLIEGKAGLEEGQREEVDDVAVHKAAELPVLEGSEKRSEGLRLAGFAVNVFALLDVEGGNQHCGAGDGGHNADGKTDGVLLPDGALEHASDVGQHEGETLADDECEGDIGRYVNSVLLRIAELCNQGVVGRAEDRHEQIEDDKQRKEQDVIDDDGACLRQYEETNGHERKWHRDRFHKGNSAAAFVIAAVGPAGDQRVRDRIKDASHGQDKAEECQFEQDRLLGNGGGEDAGVRVLRVRTAGVVIHHPVGDDAGEKAPSELADGENPEQLVSDLFHGDLSFPKNVSAMTDRG